MFQKGDETIAIQPLKGLIGYKAGVFYSHEMNVSLNVYQ
ncbi:hypothetical protein BRUCa_2268 [Brucella melitensis]|nr:conserved hypothetical protein [Brucella melitensis M28]ADZ88222.1 conserved hypothetical protein [Brucella melitensis M5-90]